MADQITKYAKVSDSGTAALIDVVKGRSRALTCIFSTTDTAEVDLQAYLSSITEASSVQPDAALESTLRSRLERHGVQLDKSVSCWSRPVNLGVQRFAVSQRCIVCTGRQPSTERRT